MSEETVGGYRFRGNFWLPLEDYAQRKGETKYLVAHCAATPATFDGGVDTIRKWHIKDNGWLDVGYHMVIKRDGTIERGRPIWAVGAGVAGYNSASIHVCLVGGVDNDGKAEDNFTSIQKEALSFVFKNLRQYVAPKAEVCGHRDFPGVQKDCPSFDAKAWWLKELQKTIHEEVQGPVFRQRALGELYLN